MNINKAINILELSSKYNSKNITELTQQELKHTYHILALNYHPDKNKNYYAKEKFQNVQNAYSFLNKLITYNIDINSNFDDDNDNDNDNDNNNNEIYSTPYTELVINLLKLLLKNFENNEIKKNEIDKFQQKCIDYSFKIIDKLFDKINVSVLEDLYKFINNNNIFNYSLETLNFFKEIIKKKLIKYNIYIINPGLDSIFNSEIFKLEISNGDYIYIPLWHSELIYEENIIKIEPILQNNIGIDINNNLHYNYCSTFENLVQLIHNNINYINIKINNIDFKLPISSLYFKKQQMYVFKKVGIPIANPNDIFDNNIKGNIIININLQ